MREVKREKNGQTGSSGLEDYGNSNNLSKNNHRGEQKNISDCTTGCGRWATMAGSSPISQEQGCDATVGSPKPKMVWGKKTSNVFSFYNI